MNDEQRAELERQAREDAEQAPPLTPEQRYQLRLIFGAAASQK